MELRIKEIIKEKGLTISSLAEKMDINRVNLSNMINGNPTLETLEKIANALDVPITELFQSESSLYGVVMFNGKPYKIDSVAKLRELIGDIDHVAKG